MDQVGTLGFALVASKITTRVRVAEVASIQDPKIVHAMLGVQGRFFPHFGPTVKNCLWYGLFPTIFDLNHSCFAVERPLTSSTFGAHVIALCRLLMYVTQN